MDRGDVTLLLLERGAKVNPSISLQHTVSWLDRVDPIASLQGQDVDINARIRLYCGAQYAAVSQGHPKALQLLLARNADVVKRWRRYETATSGCCRTRLLDLVKWLVSAGSDIDVADSLGGTALHFFAANAADVGLQDVLVHAGCMIKALDYQACRPSSYAEHCGCRHIVEDILRRLNAADQADE